MLDDDGKEIEESDVVHSPGNPCFGDDKYIYRGDDIFWSWNRFSQTVHEESIRPFYLFKKQHEDD